MKTTFYTLFLLFCTVTLSAQNYGILFDGASQKIELCSSDDFNIGEDFTVEAWIFASEWRPEFWQGSIITRDQQAGTSGWAFRAGMNGTLSFVIGVGSEWPEAVSEPIMNANQWHHVAAVKTGNTLQLYINGNLSATTNLPGEPVHNNQVVVIGESSGFPGRQWRGLIDEVRVWNISRTAEEIEANQTVDLTGNEAGLVAYMPMNDGASLNASNLVDENCDATFVNMTEAAWQDGYAIPETDVGVVNITAPDVLSIFTRPVKLRAEIQNFGSEPVSNIPIEVTINGLPAFSQTFNITLRPSEIQTVVFDQVIDLTDNNTNLISIATQHPDDLSTINDDISYRYRKPRDGKLVNILNEEQFNFGSAGQSKFTDINLPENVEDFEQILLHISVECPNTGCDPWDQPAKISVERPDGSTEIARFITPFGIGCGTWVVDVTDFKSILVGGVTIKSFVQVWGPSGWLVNLDLEYIEGDSPSFNKVSALWESDNLIYGDPNISYDLPEQEIIVDENTLTNHIRMTISGHGQGNTNNAAEFSNMSHDFVVNNEVLETHNLWKADCQQNACSNQAGTWTLNRAGWCPGQAVEPYIVNLTNTTTPGEAVNIDYDLQEYTNLLNTGYDGQGHTEPHYRLFSYFVESSDTRFKDYTNLRAEQISILTNGDVSNPVINSLDFRITNNGTVDVSNPTVSYFVNDVFIFEETVATTIEANQSYTHSFSQNAGFDFSGDNLIYAVVSANGDQNINDDATKTSINADLVSTHSLEVLNFELSPNPSSGKLIYTLNEVFLHGKITVVDMTGRTILRQNINDLNGNLFIENKGLFVLQFQTKKGNTISKRVVIE